MTEKMDYMVRGIAAGGQIRAFAADTRNLVEKARQIHNSSPVVTAALGRLMTGALMMGSMMKGEKDVLTLQVRGDGPVKGLTVTANGKGEVKGYAGDPQVILPATEQGKLAVGACVGAGYLSVVKDLGLKEPYVGQVELQTGEIAEDLTYYFAVSEQTPSSVGLGVLMNRDNTVRQAGGFMIQLMPSAEDRIIDKLEEKIKILQPVTTMLDRGLTPEQLLEEVLQGLDLEITDKTEVNYVCDCSRERAEKAILCLGKKDLEELIGEEKPIEVHCEFCNSFYEFTTEELRRQLS